VVPILRGVGWATAVLVLAVALAAAAASRTQLYVGREVLNHVHVFWGASTAFVCASRVSTAAPATLLNTVVQYDPLIPLRHASRIDLVVAEIGPAGYSSRMLVNHQDGRCYVHHGVLHFRPVDSRSFSFHSGTPAAEAIRFRLENDRRWDGGSFRGLVEEEKVALVEEIARNGQIATIAAAEGWQDVASPGAPVSFALLGTPIVVQSEQSVPEGRFQKVTVKVGENQERPLLLVRHGEHLTSRSAYEALDGAAGVR
jgi:hypothetical protein